MPTKKSTPKTTITLTDLQNADACSRAVRTFKRTFPSGRARVTRSNLVLAHSKGLCLYYLARNLLYPTRAGSGVITPQGQRLQDRMYTCIRKTPLHAAAIDIPYGRAADRAFKRRDAQIPHILADLLSLPGRNPFTPTPKPKPKPRKKVAKKPPAPRVRIITARTLKLARACDTEVNRFRKRFPKGLPLTRAGLLRAHRAQFSMGWASYRLFNLGSTFYKTHAQHPASQAVAAYFYQTRRSTPQYNVLRKARSLAEVEVLGDLLKLPPSR